MLLTLINVLIICLIGLALFWVVDKFVCNLWLANLLKILSACFSNFVASVFTAWSSVTAVSTSSAVSARAASRSLGLASHAPISKPRSAKAKRLRQSSR